VGREAAEGLAAVIKAGAAFDDHMGDMLVPFLALANGESQYTVANLTSHLSTNIEVVKMFIKTEIEAVKHAGNVLIKVRGVGLNMM